MVTIEKKDAIVDYLASAEESLFDFDPSELKKDDITYNECDMILRQLEKMGFIDIKRRYSNPSGYDIAINSGLHEFSSRGAFTTQEIMLKIQLEKLDTEMQLIKSKLEPNTLEQLNNIFSIFGSACSMLPYVNTYITS